MIFWFYLSTAVFKLMKFNGQNVSGNLYNALILLHAAHLNYDQDDRCAAHGRLKLESPVLYLAQNPY